MKLSPYIQQIKQAYQALLLDATIATDRPELAFNYSTSTHPSEGAPPLFGAALSTEL
jgi:hypothetical protein